MLRSVFLWISLAATLSAARKLEIYVIDVEGGKSVLFVSPSGQTMLFDVGWPALNNRPASTDRIAEVARAAHVKSIDHLVISHFDIDHIGDVPQLLSRIPVGHIYDHGDPQTSSPRFAAYATVRDRVGRTILKPGDRVPFKGVEVRVLSAGGRLIKEPLPNAGAPNPLCGLNPQAEILPTDVEDNQSIGLLISWGKFRMLDLADLEAHYAHELACPNNLIGHVDVYNVNVHGQFKGIAPELVGALAAPVFIQANGSRKGADAQTWPVLRSSAGLQDIWQLHESLNAGKEMNPPQEFIANSEPADGFHWLRITVERDGSFTITNSRNAFSKRYT